MLDRIRQLPLASRRALATGIVFVVGILLVGLWVAIDFGIPNREGGIAAISDGAKSVGNLIQEQTDQYSKTKTRLEQNLDQTLKSSALVLPQSLQGVREEPDGVLFLGYEHRERGTFVKLDDVTFYPSYTLVRATLTNESGEPLFVDAGRGSVLVQQSASSYVSLQPLYQSGTPAEISAGQSVQAQITFGPLNGRQPFELVVGDIADNAQFASEAWSAQFKIDPSKVVQE
ncbi:MAG: hypothetical protein V1895_01405 [Parcubacteria group bacterium]